jgi:ribonuclease Z
MRPSFIPRLVNTELFDPIVYVCVLNEKKALMFDCGRIEGLTNREILALDAIFVSHTHMDHFIGIDQVLRIILHREKPMHIYGPRDITSKMLAKLNAYTWNLTQDYPLEVIIHEVRDSTVNITKTMAGKGFEVVSQQVEERDGNTIATAPRYCVDAVILDHQIACLGFVLREIFHINIRREAIADSTYIPGPWIGRLKECIFAGITHEVIEVAARGGIKKMPVEELREELVIITSGQKIAFFTDIGFSEENIRRIETIAQDVDILFIEAYYLDELRELAGIKGHLTARQAGTIARRLGAKRVYPMHVSPRYHTMMSEIHREMQLPAS